MGNGIAHHWPVKFRRVNLPLMMTSCRRLRHFWLCTLLILLTAFQTLQAVADIHHPQQTVTPHHLLDNDHVLQERLAHDHNETNHCCTCHAHSVASLFIVPLQCQPLKQINTCWAYQPSQSNPDLEPQKRPPISA